ncbi:MAG: hypothetical protein FWF90_04445 [Promicromonosporaceae bacterium]|nr:hypothetical protein [Promicromonosporaceae bacterium]
MSETTAEPARLARPQVLYRGRHLPMVAVVIAATIATALAYSGMVLFGLDVAHMTPPEAYALAGFLEVSLVAVALMARNAALEGRPYGVLLVLTWILSGTSGLFAALHQIAVPDASTPYMVAFRFVPPLVAALMWHLALVGERHLVTGHTLDERRRESRVHEYVTALELWRDAQVDSAGDRAGLRRVRAAHRRQLAARDSALRILTVEDFEGRMQAWVERLESAERHGSRLEQLGASSAKRGIGGGGVGLAPQTGAYPALTGAVPALTGAVPALTGAVPMVLEAAGVPVAATDDVLEIEAEHDVAEAPVTDAEVEVEEAPEADAEPFAEVLEAALHADEDAEPKDAPEPADEPVVHTPKLPETGLTRRVEVFDLVKDDEPAADEPAHDAAEKPADDEATEPPTETAAHKLDVFLSKYGTAARLAAASQESASV